MTPPNPTYEQLKRRLRKAGQLLASIHFGGDGPSPVAERTRVEESLQGAEARYRGLFEQSPYGVLLIDPATGRVIEANEAVHRQLGYTREEFATLGISDYEALETPEETQAHVQKVLAEGSDDFETLHRTQSGEIRNVHVWAKTVRVGERLALHCVFQDITDRKRAERAARESTRALLESQQVARLGSYRIDLLAGTWSSSAVLDEIFGIPLESFTRDVAGWLTVVHPDQRAEMAVYFAEEVVGKRQRFDREYRIVRVSDGAERWVHGFGELVADRDGRLVEMIGTIQDVTERKRAEDALRQADQRFRDVVDSTDGIVWEADADSFVFNFVSSNAERMLGYPLAEWLRPGFWAGHIHPEDRDRAVQYCMACTARVEDHEFGYRFIAHDGRVVWLRDIVRVVPEQGKPRWLRGLMVDVTAPALAEAARRAADERYRLVVQATNDVVWDWDITATHVWWSDNARAVLGYAPEELGSEPLSPDRIHPEDREMVRDRLASVLAPGDHAFSAEYRFHQPDGSYIYLFTRAHVVRDERGTPVRMIGAVADISDRVHAERRYHDIFTFAPLGIYQSNREGRVLEANPALARMLGYDSPDALFALHMDRDVYFEPAEREELIAHATGAVVPDVEVQWKKKDGTPLWVHLAVQRHYDADGNLRYFEGFVRDINDRKRLEDQLRQSQKMEAVGQLAGGIAHDFNNLLTAITGYSDLLYEDLGAEDPRRADVAEIRDAAGRAAQLTRQLLAFSRKQVLQPRTLDLNAVVSSIEKMLTRLVGETVSLRTRLAASIGTVRADPGQVEQVIMNLAVNARDAMPDGGELTLETANVDLDDDYTRTHVGARSGRHVMLAVSDTGVGMDPATQARLFEPFFTTKGPGKGTGLGLSTVYGIVKQSGGHVWVYSEVGRGTTFKVYLPRTDAPADIAPQVQAQAPKRGTETILVVEDADLLRALARRVLEGFGYTVLTAHGGGDALAIAAAHAGPIQLLLTDVVMPEMGGAELAKRLAAQRADVLVLYMSGYTDDAIVRQGVLTEGVAFIQKPFTAETLVRRVREVLDASGGPRGRAGTKVRLSS